MYILIDILEFFFLDRILKLYEKKSIIMLND